MSCGNSIRWKVHNSINLELFVYIFIIRFAIPCINVLNLSNKWSWIHYIFYEFLVHIFIKYSCCISVFSPIDNCSCYFVYIIKISFWKRIFLAVVLVSSVEVYLSLLSFSHLETLSTTSAYILCFLEIKSLIIIVIDYGFAWTIIVERNLIACVISLNSICYIKCFN